MVLQESHEQGLMWTLPWLCHPRELSSNAFSNAENFLTVASQALSLALSPTLFSHCAEIISGTPLTLEYAL